MDPVALLHFVTDPTRQRLLRRLRRGDATVSQLVDAVGAEQSNVSHHLRALREAGLVRADAAGRHRHYRLADPQVTALLDEVADVARRLEQAAFLANLEIPADSAFHGYG